MIGHDWKAGDKIVCVDASTAHCGGPTFSSPMLIHLEQDKIYEIQCIAPLPRQFLRRTDFDSVLFVDVVGIPRWRDGIPNFLTTRFRKVLPDRAEGNKEDFKLLLSQHKSKPAKTPAKVPVPVPVPAKTVPQLPAPGWPFIKPF